MLRKTGIALLISICLAACNPTGERKASRHETPLETIPVRDTAAQQPIVTGDNSQNSLDWNGTYEATLPCADCPGIKTILTLVADQTFTLSSTYLEDQYEEHRYRRQRNDHLAK